MNLALGTLLLFLLVIPGISFRNGYFFGPLSKKFTKSTAFDDFIWAIVPGLFFQLLFAAYINSTKPWSYEVNFDSLGKILFATSDANKEFGKIQNNLGAILSYNVFLTILAGLLGIGLRHFIRVFHLDHYSKVFRFSNEWYYALRGETKFFRENIPQHERVLAREKTKANWKRQKTISAKWAFVRLLVGNFFKRNKLETCTIHAVVKSDKGDCYIYSGIIQSFYLLRDGSLDTIILKGARRRKFFDTVEPAAYEIPTNLVILKNSEIVTISVTSVIDIPIIQIKPSSKSPVANSA